MIPSKDDALLQTAVDGELTRDERVEFDRLLATSAEARDRFAALRKLTSIVEELGSVAPPANLARAVTGAVFMRNNGKGPRGRIVQGEMFMARKTMIGLAAAAAVVLVTFAVTGYPPIGKGTEGTISQANRFSTSRPSSP